MSDTLVAINKIKQARVNERKARVPLAEVEAKAKAAVPTRGFAKALQAKVDAGQYALIAEVKKASPSAGLIRADFDPAKLALAYERAGAACLSVLTEEDHFQGSDAYMVAARNATKLPVLRKDFMLEPYQIIESRALGADCILIIMASLSDTQAAELESTAFDCGLDALVEVHDADEFERAMKLKSPLIGVNNRNLRTLKTDLATTEQLAALLPKDRVLIAESGLKTPADMSRMSRVGAKRFLIGESLMRQTDVEAATRAILTMEPAHA